MSAVKYRKHFMSTNREPEPKRYRMTPIQVGITMGTMQSAVVFSIPIGYNLKD